MQHKTITSPRGRTHYWTQGQGDAIVLLHGATMDHHLWRRQVDDIGAKHALIVPDLPAHGRSRPYTDFSLKAAADEVIRILDQEQADACHFVGQSMGGYISQIIALEHPNRVRSIAAVGSTPIGSAYYSRFDHLMFSIGLRFMALFPHGPLVRTMAKEVANTQPVRDYALETLGQLSKQEIRGISSAVLQGLVDYSKQRVTLTCPVLVVHGEQDSINNVISYSERWAREDGLLLRTVPEAGHNSNMDNPAVFNRILFEFLANTDGFAR